MHQVAKGRVRLKRGLMLDPMFDGIASIEELVQASHQGVSFTLYLHREIPPVLLEMAKRLGLEAMVSM